MPQVVTFEPMPNSVFILGAGFSHAISPTMPLTNELGREVLRYFLPADADELDAPVFGDDGLSFEAWFSWLSERQPYETERAFHRAQSMFFQLQNSIATVIREKQSLVEELPLKRWLVSLIDLMHHSEATVITLNYDTLFESAFRRLLFTDRSGAVTYPADILKIFPARDGVMFGPGPLRANSTLDLYKLHGSVDWYWVPSDTAGSTLERAEEWPAATPVEKKSRQAAIGGKVEFIVPPTNSKTAFFENSKTRFLWEQSYLALNNAERVVLIGYSLPMNDAALASMLSRSLKRSDATVVIVNPAAAAVARKLISIGISAERIISYDGEDCMEKYVRDEEIWTSKALAVTLNDPCRRESEELVAVGWCSGQIAQVVGSQLDPDSGVLTLLAAELGEVTSMHRPGIPDETGNSESNVKTLREVLNHGANADQIERLEVDIPGHGVWPLGGWMTDFPGIEIYEGAPNWLLLRPIGQLPRQ